jgi:methylthioribose-1-phosphate isomerase
MLKPIEWKENSLYLLDQRQLPSREIYIQVNTLAGTIDAILQMVVRGAPCIGFTGIFGVAFSILESKQGQAINAEHFNAQIEQLKNARPTAVNLAYEIKRSLVLIDYADFKSSFDKVISFVQNEIEQSEQRHLNMSKHCHSFLTKLYGDKKLVFQTHCNTGRLACASHGTALGVIEYYQTIGQLKHVWVDETRPYLQGSRLTAFELSYLQASYTIIADSAAAYIMHNNQVDAIVVGADRIAANGDTANKIGTFNLAVVAKSFNVPFIVLAPKSSFDTKLANGSLIEIEMRSIRELTHFHEKQITPGDANVLNPSFDITPAHLITAIVYEDGYITNEEFFKIKEKIK